MRLVQAGPRRLRRNVRWRMEHDQAGVPLGERGWVNVRTELGGNADVRTSQKLKKTSPAWLTTAVRNNAAFVAVPHREASHTPRRITARRLHLDHLRAEVRHEHGCHRSSNAGAQIEHPDALQRTAHGNSSARWTVRPRL